MITRSARKQVIKTNHERGKTISTLTKRVASEEKSTYKSAWKQVGKTNQKSGKTISTPTELLESVEKSTEKGAGKQVDKTNKKSERTISTLIEQVERGGKSPEETETMENGIVQVLTSRELVPSNHNRLILQPENQLQLQPLNIYERAMMMSKETNQSQQILSPVVNIYINVSPTKTDSPPVLQTVQPIIHVHYNESNESQDGERMSLQESVVKRTVSNFLSVSSTDLRTTSFHFGDTSDIVNNLEEHHYISSNQKAITQSNNTDIDVSDLCDISNSEKSSDSLLAKVSQNNEPAIQAVNVKERPSQKRPKRVTKKSKKNPDKDFASVSLKLQNKLRNLIRKQIVNVNSISYNSVKNKIICTRYKHLIKFHKKKWKFIRKHSNLLEKSGKDTGDKNSTDYVPEVIVLSDSDSPTEKSNKEEEVKGTKKDKRKNKVKSTRKHKVVDHIEDVPMEDGNRKHKRAEKSVALKKPKAVRKPKPKDKTKTTKPKDKKVPKGKKSSKEQHLNWVKKVAFAKACQLQPKVFAEKEILVHSKGKRTKRSGTEREEGLFTCETPQRPNVSYENFDERFSEEINYVEFSPDAPDTSNWNERNEDPVLAWENEWNEEIFPPNQEQPYEYQDVELENERNEEIYNSKEAQRLENRLEPSLASGDGHDEEQQIDNLVWGKTSDRLSGARPSQRPTLVADKEILEEPVDNPNKGQELREKWLASLASYDKKRESQRKDSLAWFETPKRSSWSQSRGKPLSSRINGMKYSHKAPGSANSKQGENERDEEVCTSAVTPSRGRNFESINNKRRLTLLAEGCNFSEILQKFREKYYKDKVEVFCTERNRNNNDQVSKKPSSVAKESPLRGVEPEKRSLSGDFSNMQTVKRKKEKEKSDKFKNDNKADENLNPSLSPQEPVNCLLSTTEKPLQRTDPPILPQEKESLSETSMSAIRTPFIPIYSTPFVNIQSNNEKNSNYDGSNIPVSEISIIDGINVKEPCDNSSSAGNETTPENNVVLQEGNHESDDHINKFREIKKKFRLLPDNKLPRYNLQANNVFESSDTQLDTCRKVLLNQCMAQDTSDIKQPEETDSRLRAKRKGRRDSSAGRSVSTEKKMKQSKSSNKKSFTGDDYIPLDATGPTRFAVAPLDKVTPYREHAAKDFKRDMLYGNRVKRFSSPKSLDVYKSKQKASRKKSSY